MKRHLVLVMVGCLAFAMVFSGRSQAATWPQKGKVMTIIVPWPAGGPGDVAARLLAPELEKNLGIPVQVENKPGAGTQVGVTALVLSKPDGYTIAEVSLPTVFTIYLDPSRKAVFSRKDLKSIGLQLEDPVVFGVRAASPFKTIKDVVESAKARPDKVTVASTSFLGTSHLPILHLQKLAKIKLATVQFEGAAPALPALLGGHVDVYSEPLGGLFGQIKAGSVRVLGVMGRNRSMFLPDVPTMEEQGYPMFWGVSRLYVIRSGTPVEVVELIRRAFDKAMESEGMKERIKAAGSQYRFLNGEAMDKYWNDTEATATPLIKEALREIGR